MSVDQKQEVDAEVQAEVAVTQVDATVQAETAETPVVVQADEPAPAVETPAQPADVPAPVEPPVVKAEPPKKRTTPAKAAKAVETPVVVQTDTPAPAPAAETPVAVQEDEPAPVPAVEAEQKDEVPVKPLANGLSWGSKRKEKQAKESIEQSCEVEVTNTGAYSFETYTRTPLPSNQTVVVKCESPRQRAAIVSKLNKLNQLAGVNRYIILTK